MMLSAGANRAYLGVVLMMVPATVVSGVEKSVPRLDPDRAVRIVQAQVDLGAAELDLSDGWLIPVVRDDFPETEWLFVGEGRLGYVPPDLIEAHQLLLFTGQEKLDEPVNPVFLANGDVEAIVALRTGAESGLPNRVVLQQAGEWLASWDDKYQNMVEAEHVSLRMKFSPEKMIHYRSLFCRSEKLGLLYYEYDPEKNEQVTLSGLEKNDEGAGEPSRRVLWTSHTAEAGSAPLDYDSSEDRYHYRIELSISEEDLGIVATADVELPVPDTTEFVVEFSLLEDLEVTAVQSETGRKFRWSRSGKRLLVFPDASAPRTHIIISYEGEIFDRIKKNVPVQKQTTHWYPNLPGEGKATFEVTIDWPERYDLLGGGRIVESEQVDGRKKERRILEIPVLGMTFEIGKFDLMQTRVGHVDLIVGFNDALGPVSLKVKQETVRVLSAAVLYFEAKFGMLDMDTLTVATMPRTFSQGLLGFVTLAHGVLASGKSGVDMFGSLGSMQEIRMEHIAHEVSHQWWGNKVGWVSYRDQWLSEAMAEFSARQFMRRIVNQESEYLARRAKDARRKILEVTSSGRVYGSLGPVVLGVRLARNYPNLNVYSAIVYEKGSIVFSMLARQLGEDPLFLMMGDLAQAVDHTRISTGTFFRALEKMSGRDLQPFAQRYVYGTGREEIYYDFSFLEEDGTWRVEGQATRVDILPSRIAVVGGSPEDGHLVRSTDPPGALPPAGLVVPFQVALQARAGSGQVQEGLGGTLTLNADVTRFSIPLPSRPSDFWLDQRGEILAEFMSKNRRPKIALFRQGKCQEENGEQEKAERFYLEALEASSRMSGSGSDSIPREQLAEEIRRENIRIHLALGSLYTDMGRAVLARERLSIVAELLPRKASFQKAQRVLLRSKIDFLDGRYRPVVTRLEKFLLDEKPQRHLERWLRDRKELRNAWEEALALLTLAAWKAGLHDVVDEVLPVAESFGVDMQVVREARAER